ncbi:bifunctional DNA-binding transcriptional regulator/O6-methylguanine-DNA methyltransferase Ada [Sphingomonas sp. PL-96]|uniref:bifunctional DNA-binding transcriptional regulator/O6-methylguanine-DNA methyltransferase Ada n=1 Tax=Sphingomonas sp. PL-96 TaxID=2887201 RepID=UPI001E4DC7DF|nr:bifunctional DNA-binding transcriptional regulator/O6-methylguanine-DNA methyltransferase Ada [Sphingomonas sp. PL-96]MCC2975259.1 bifunctional DNA-binding transcriptional regulator/O6-methylguanine-DNA methyltransferase Ada [Sphingomonas sp. PL-96]
MTQQEMTQDPRWARIMARDASGDGEFWYSVATTGVYCRPSCPSRAANPANVTIHATLAEARRTGARACLRCRPDAAGAKLAHTERVAAACRSIETAETQPTLAELAAAAGMSAGHFQRVFKAATGVSPRAYAAEHRASRVRAALQGGAGVTEAIHTAGYGSSGRFYAEADAVLGMKPAAYRRGGAAETLRFAVTQTSLGLLLVAASETGIAALLLGEDADALEANLRHRFPNAHLEPGDAAFGRLVTQVVAFVDAPDATLDLPLDIRGTAFRRRVWEELRAIPAGETASYADIARRIGAPAAVRAVAGACAANAHALAIPCHRVLRSDGALSGFRWGTARKRALLDREAAARRD